MNLHKKLCFQQKIRVGEYFWGVGEYYMNPPLLQTENPQVVIFTVAQSTLDTMALIGHFGADWVLGPDPPW